jgi:DNA-binding NtrC family response regulator
MPIKSGYAALKEFKELYPHAKAIQMTGDIGNKISEHADSHMYKPFDLDTIEKVVGQYLAKK